MSLSENRLRRGGQSPFVPDHLALVPAPQKGTVPGGFRIGGMTRLRLSFAVGFLSLLMPAAAVNAQVPEDLAQPKAFRALRISSTDPHLKNGDYRPIAPGATLELGQIEGHGRITHMWFTINGKSADHLRELVLRIFWDGADKPAIECPLGDFFGLGFGRYVEYKSAPVAIGGVKALNCYWPMPFAKGARLTMINEGSEPVANCYFNIDYRLDDQPAADIRYFHTQYRQAFPAPKGEDYLILDAAGRGHFVGTFLSVMANSDGWWGEGNDKFYVDGASKPTIEGTGSEDYFCGAWDFQHAFSNPYSGVPLYDNPEKGGEKRGILNTCYRWHILDPVPFTKSLRVTIEHGRSGPNDDRQPLRNHYASVAYYYLDRAEGEGAPLPPHSQRIPKLLPLPEAPRVGSSN
ncbi:MAG TPA: glycoside hydrolase family 172 protein [Pirellulales bacterium]|nr:glycoside hydrolase family 172 protein [Pirellulales bacterium]